MDQLGNQSSRPLRVDLMSQIWGLAKEPHPSSPRGKPFRGKANPFDGQDRRDNAAFGKERRYLPRGGTPLLESNSHSHLAFVQYGLEPWRRDRRGIDQ